MWLIFFFIPLFALNISVTILPQKYIINAIDKEANVNVLVPPGTSPATYSPTFKEIKNIKNSQIYFTIGVPFDKKYSKKFKELNPNLKIVSQSKCLKFNNPHVWLSPIKLICLAKTTLNTLISLNPSKKEIYIKNFLNYTKTLLNLEKEGFKIKKSFITFHPSFYHFAKDFNIKEIALEKEGKAPSLKYIQKVINIAKKEKIDVVIISPEFPKKYAQIIANKLNAKVYVISPLNDPIITIKELIKALK